MRATDGGANSDLDRRIAAIRTKRERVLASPRGRSRAPEWWPTWDAHHSRAGRASTEEVAAIEARSAMVLPDEYRRFLVDVADGGFGPGCGMFALSEAVTEAPEWTGNLAVPFCYGDEDARRAMGQRAGGRFFSLDQPNDEGLPHGCLLLAHTGCGCFDVLVVTGEQRGTVWFHDTRQLFPLAERGAQVTFLDWYESWLDGWIAATGA